MAIHDHARENRIALLTCLLFIYILYHLSFLPHLIRQTRLTHKLKLFATDVSHKYVYGILFMLLSLALFPHTFASVMAYFFFLSMVVALWGYVLDSQKVLLGANFCAALFSAAIGLGILVYHWEWIPGDA
eukprot:TRINITY_DN16382_c0_g1_i1.p1 TRINITY_DN16382_c0_g1~~TRINITY_DN16382_c0_g1_i1.p1  ORF type:complete len:130 (-),score=22.12 TRINITY_DN16382_c0_g1_i1:71-460(-)